MADEMANEKVATDLQEERRLMYVGINTIEAMILAKLEKAQEEVSDDDFEEILDELHIKPRLLHPTGKFRNIRRFAFVIHPLSQSYIQKGLPIPKSPKSCGISW